MASETLWERVTEIFGEALERDANDRAAFLREACAGDKALLREVESLLAASARAAMEGDFLNQPALEEMAMAMNEEQNEMIGREISHYRILSLLGSGGMGEVFLAEDERLGRNVALKFLPREFTQDRERVQRFKQEARAASALNHPNIITIFEIDEVDGAYFIATEFIDGLTLRERLAAGRIEIAEALEIASQIAGALAEAHAAGITHRDIKPENVMLRRDGYIKVLDFGLAKLSEPFAQSDKIADGQTQPRVNTDPGKVMGTPRYMAPEQIIGKQVDSRADIFSLGVVVYEMATGRSPFDGDTVGEIIAAVLNHEPALLRDFDHLLPAELERIACRALMKDRELRYQNARDVLSELKNLKFEIEMAARSKRDDKSSPPEDASRTLPLPQSQLPKAIAISIASSGHSIEPAGGAVPLDSQFYIVRPTDEEFRTAIARRDSIVLVKGARQVGKTSLLARGLQQARAAGAKIVLTDLQKLNTGDLVSANTFFFAMADLIGDQLELEVLPEEVWNDRRSPSINFERFMRREVLGKINAPLVWGLDEVDRLFTTTFGSEVFGLFRSWHNERSLDPEGPWQRMTMAIAYATEAHLFITDMNQSPFNVGTRLALDDFNFDQVAELNARYGSPLADNAETARYFRLVGGHPYLVRCGLQEMVTHHRDLPKLETIADHEDGPFGDHLRRIAASLEQDAELCEIVRGILQGKPCPTQESFYRLRSAGLVTGDSAREARPRCQLYANYLGKRLL
ncbi:MAG: AAA-like domain-containing protein [Acidobacteriota bacterium]|nr:AAA-like domain-containing protein [Acidobacteriota bacterium]